jgi:hypothetical protein
MNENRTPKNAGSPGIMLLIADGLLTSEQLNIVRFCAVECKMQVSGEESVWWMVEAWNWAIEQSRLGSRPSPARIRTLGALVEPRKNVSGFRTIGVRVGCDVKGDWQHVPRQIENLCRCRDSKTAADWFYEYEDIHPFVDGNGRTGQILFNWLAGSLGAPEWAPNFWNDSRHGYMSSDDVYHDKCMTLRHVRGQLDDLTKFVQFEADDNAKFRVEYRLKHLDDQAEIAAL